MRHIKSISTPRAATTDDNNLAFILDVLLAVLALVGRVKV